jgi:hypothetical protein
MRTAVANSGDNSFTSLASAKKHHCALRNGTMYRHPAVAVGFGSHIQKPEPASQRFQWRVRSLSFFTNPLLEKADQDATREEYGTSKIGVELLS